MQGSTQPEVWDSNIQLGNGCNKSIWEGGSVLYQVCQMCASGAQGTTNKQTNK